MPWPPRGSQDRPAPAPPPLLSRLHQRPRRRPRRRRLAAARQFPPPSHAVTAALTQVHRPDLYGFPVCPDLIARPRIAAVTGSQPLLSVMTAECDGDWW